MEATAIIASIEAFIQLGDKLLDKFPDYKDRVINDWVELKQRFDTYKKRPRHQRVSSYLLNLKVEIENQVLLASEYIK